MVRGGAAALADALAAELRGARRRDRDRPPGRVARGPAAGAGRPASTSPPRQLAAIAGDRLPDGTAGASKASATARACSRSTGRSTGPIPWAADGARRAGDGPPRRHARRDRGRRGRGRAAAGTRSGRSCCSSSTRRGTRPARPDGKATAWAYCHVPRGSTVDMTDRIEAQVERFAPGFRDRILARSYARPAAMEAARRELRRRRHQRRAPGPPPALLPAVRRARPVLDAGAGLYLCSSSTPPGGGVHGMCGVRAARSALRREFGERA